MALTVIRHTGWFGIATKLSLKINGEQVARIAHEQELKLDLKSAPSTLRVSQLGIRSNEIEVQEGDTVMIKNSIWTYIFIVLFALILLLNFVEGFYQLKSIASILVLVFAIGSLFFLDTYRLEKTENKRLL